MTTLPSFDEARGRIDRFLKTLTETNITIMFFNIVRNKTATNSVDLIPGLRDKFLIWNKDEKTVHYVLKGGGKDSSGWLYIYTDLEIKRLINVDPYGKVTIVGYSGQEPALLSGGGDRKPDEINVPIGIHYTLGTGRTKPDKVLIFTHKTMYNPDPTGEDPTFFTRDQSKCNFTLEGIIDKNQPCEKFNSGSTISYLYADDKSDVLVELVNNVLLENSKISQGGAKKEYHKYNGRRYLIKTGIKNGKYIEFRDKKRHYILKKQNGGTTIQVKLTDEFLQFISKYILNPVVVKYELIDYVELIYDLDGTVLPEYSNTQLTIIYHFSEPTEYVHIFYVDAQKAYEAHLDEIGIVNGTPSATNNFETFKNTVETEILLREILVY